MARSLSDNEHERLQLSILRKLYIANAWGKGHLLVARLKSGIPPHLRGHVKEVLRDLINEEFICVYGQTKNGVAVHLNIKRQKEITELVKR